jgi:uncharacterized membrane protein
MFSCASSFAAVVVAAATTADAAADASTRANLPAAKPALDLHRCLSVPNIVLVLHFFYCK